MKRWAIRGSLALLALALLLSAAALFWLRASLPILEGEHRMDALTRSVTVSRDRYGVVTVNAENEMDLVRAIGFVHGQERFFQMDLLRRSAAGEIASLVGAAAVDFDRDRRIHGLREVSQRILDGLGEGERALLHAYATGVNAGLEALDAQPFEYALLGVESQAWLPEDSLLVAFAMYFDLHDETARRERFLAALYAVFPSAFVDFLVPPGTAWDAPVVGEAVEEPPIPGAHVMDFRKRDADVAASAQEFIDESGIGSNSWAVDAARSVNGAAMVANDMHLGLDVPNIWFRMRLTLDAADGFDVTGVSLPGFPGIVAGSNGWIAWGFTNSYGDWIDLVRLDETGCASGYRTPRGCENFEIVDAQIDVAHDDPVTFEYLRSRWGPVIEDRANGEELRYALRWTAHDPQATNMRLLGLARARDIDTAFAVAHAAGMPPQNLVVADAGGNIGWTIIGRIPRRNGHTGRLPLDSAVTNEVWSGWLEPAEIPRLINPPHGRLWSANARMVDGEALAKLGDGGYALGARAGQIRDRLFEKERLDVDDMLAIQLDDEARFLERWKELLLALLDEEATAERSEREALREVAAAWEGNASVDAIAYRLVRAWRNEVLQTVFGGLTAEVKSQFPGFGFGAFTQTEGPVWQLVTARPAHLLPAGYGSWRELLLAAADRVQERVDNLKTYRWGARNTSRIDHPLGQVPLLGSLLNAPRTELPGDVHMPRVQGPAFGASERFAVSPGREGEGYFHMPGGQGGHPLSPFYLSGHAEWENGRATPFLPGAPRYTLQLVPAIEETP